MMAPAVKLMTPTILALQKPLQANDEPISARQPARPRPSPRLARLMRRPLAAQR